MAYERAATFNGCLDRKDPKKPIIWCEDCLEINCFKNKIRTQVEDQLIIKQD